MVNRADDPAYSARVLEYAQAMVTWRLEHADRTLTGLFVCPMGVVDARAAGPRH
jgi:hypothetical protein